MERPTEEYVDPLPASSDRYKGKVVLVTGGARGIGAGTSLWFLRNGANVCFCDKDEAPGKEKETIFNSHGPGKAAFFHCDVTNENQIKECIKFTVTTFGRLDCVVNNAGWHPPYLPIDEFSAQDFELLFRINTMSVFLFSKYGLPELRKVKGSIVNVASITASMTANGSCTYAATKGAIVSMTKALAIDEAEHGVRVNCVSPSQVWTDLWQSLAKTSPDSKAVTKFGACTQVLGRHAMPSEIASAIAYLAFDGTFVTGHDMMLTGGSELGYGYKSRIGLDVHDSVVIPPWTRSAF